MHYHDHSGDVVMTLKGAIQWFIALCLFAGAKTEGVITWVSDKMPDLESNPHDISWLPQLYDLIPHAITAGACAVFSLGCVELAKWCWRKLFKK